jgi:hypothetical protein
MFIRIILITALLAGVAVTGLNLCQLRQKITRLQSSLATQNAARQKAESDLATTERNLVRTTAALTETKSALETTTLEKQQALATAASQTRRADKLSSDLASTAKERDEAQAGLARYRATHMEPEQVAFAARRIKELEKDVASSQEAIKGLERKVDMLTVRWDSQTPILLPAGLRARVLAFDPKWRFIVLDAGEEQGVLAQGEVLISRQGKLVGRAKVSRVEKQRCVANLVPGWEFGEVAEGDVVIPAFPHS